MRVIFRCVSFFLAALAAFAAVCAPIDAFDIVWDSPSADHHGSMPLGNGDVALNAWMTKNGDLLFYIGKTDAWDDNARLLKVGKVRLHFEPNPISPGQPFRQELKLGAGCIEITVGAAPETRIRLWADANQSVVEVTSEGPRKVEVTASIELWRTNRQEVAELQTSDVLTNLKLPGGRQTPLTLEPDTMLAGQRGRIGWFHHNIKSVGPEELAQVQGLTGFEQQDPLLHRTFGAVITAERGERLDDLRLRSPRGASHRFSVFVLTRPRSTPDQ
jgi:alpha-L-fucosidase 2